MGLERIHVRRFDTHCVCEVEPAPEADPGYDWKDDVVPAVLSGLVGAGVGASMKGSAQEERLPEAYSALCRT